jgi:cytochrome c peroxidase
VRLQNTVMKVILAGAMLALLLTMIGTVRDAHSGGGDPPPPSLKTVPVPLPTNLGDFVKDNDAAIRLGKALFWDMQVGGDGKVACASCHYHAGVDTRRENTVNPGADGSMNGLTSPLTAAHFPFVGKPRADNIVGSQGVAPRIFHQVNIFAPTDPEVDDCDGDVNGVRQVTGRNAPNMIMAIYNLDNFWDGRAKREFNGATPGGTADPNAHIWTYDGTGLQQARVSIAPASQASQEVGPPNSGVEMSCAGRTFSDLGRKMYSLIPLAKQAVAADDSVLGSLSDMGDGKGLTTTYPDMIRAAFHEHLPSDLLLPDGSYTQLEANFSLCWGLAVMMYGSTLIPDQTPYDRYQEGQINALSRQQKDGLAVFLGDGRCAQCHGGAEFTNATVQNAGKERAYTNSGVRPTAEDRGRLPEAKGKFKVPTVRNVELTGPYFHTGGYLTLRQVVEFYNRGGDFNNPEKDSQIRPLGLSETQKKALVAFMLALTDPRVRYERAPFDHPALNIPNGPSLPAVGAGGRSTANPVKPFLNADPFQP